MEYFSIALTIWISIGIVIALIKMHQSRKYGFDRRLSLKTIPHYAIGVVVWPLIFYYILKEKRIHANVQQLNASDIHSLATELRPDSWIAFYLYYFNAGLGSDASFQIGKSLVHLFVGNLLSKENSEEIIKQIDNKHEHACGEFMHILANLSDSDLALLRTSAGAVLFIDEASGKAGFKLLSTEDEIKSFVSDLRSQGAQQLH